MNDISDCSTTGYSYNEHGDVVETGSYGDMTIMVEYDYHAAKNHIIYSTLYTNYPDERSAKKQLIIILITRTVKRLCYLTREM